MASFTALNRLNHKTQQKLYICTLALGILGSMSTVSNVSAEEFKIGFVNTDRIFREAAPAKAAQVKIETEFKKRDQDIQDLANKIRAQSEKLEKDGPILSESERTKRQRDIAELDKDFQRKRREFQEDLNQRRNEELGAILDRANRVIKQLAEQEKYDVILQEAVFASGRVDITEKILKVLNSGGPTPSAPSNSSAGTGLSGTGSTTK